MEIYKITNLINHKIYIGKDTTSDPNYFGSGLLIKRAFVKYGKENFIKEVIDITGDYDELSKKEIYWISKYKSTDKKIGYNIAPGGEGGDTLSNHPDLDLIREKISKNSKTKGKTYEDAFGEVRAREYRERLSKSNIRHSLGKKYDEIYSIEKSERIKSIIGQNTKDSWDDERKKIHSKLAKENIYNSLLSEESIIKNREYLKNRWSNWRKNEIFFIEETSNIIDLVEYLTKIPNTLFNNRKEFYEFIGDDKRDLIKKELFKKKKPHENNEDNKKKVIIDGIEYGSISEAVEKLSIDRSLIRFRLKSSHFKNYLFQDDDLNIKYNKYIDVDPHLSKKERVSIDGVEYGSITDATKNLNKTHDHINWRLNSKSYPNWFYLDKVVELKETGMPKLKSVSINGVQYESISKAVEGSGIDRQIMRYRLKSNNYTEYFYI